MIKEKEWIGYIAVFLVLAVALTLYAALRPKAVVQSPTFVYEEIVVSKAIKADKAIKSDRAERSIRAEKAVRMEKGISAPLPIVPPRVISQIWPEYPVSALIKGIEGLVLVQAYIGIGGNAERVEVKISSGYPELDEAAIKAVSSWRFAPAMQGNAALASWFEVPIRFRLR